MAVFLQQTTFYLLLQLSKNKDPPMYLDIPWIYVRISTRTSISCLKQYLKVVASTGLLPHSIPSDRGTETMMMASDYWRLHQALYPDQQFHEVWWYGHICRPSYVHKGHVFASKLRPGLPTGKPTVLYFTPPERIANYPVLPDLNTLNLLQQEVTAWDPHEYIPLIAQDWCMRQLNTLELELNQFKLKDIRSDSTPTHIYVYLHLRSILHQEVFDSGFQLPRCNTPNGGYNWTPTIKNSLSTVITLSILGEDEIDEEIS
ncbi:hypothetical protein B9Z19DRAFT_1068821 [Tuber borchii]|uniref:Uncharacterized protein n=1 Tax=Tuber borchii TaxID=42251 RepID=A0A2T6ZDT1_TUBBO|nr:hypothetical protein B9Z19DRAFT_1068821 [Tuber borchii]